MLLGGTYLQGSFMKDVLPVSVCLILVTACTLSPDQIANHAAETHAAVIPSSTATSTPTAFPSPSVTPTTTVTSTPIPTSTQEPIGLGVSRSEVAVPYEELGVEFDPPELDDGETVVGGYVNNTPGDEIAVVVVLKGPEHDLNLASVTVMIPPYLAVDPEEAARQHAKVLFVIQHLLDAVVPNWQEGSDWLDKAFRGFEGAEGTYASIRKEEDNKILLLELEISNQPELQALSLALTIWAK
jgi:hypothetical protein